ncbi:MAG: dienelactone hydrolase family protein [Candidatus Saccharibacteria bacterium]
MSQISEFLYASDVVTSSERALILLPEIFGVKHFTRDLADKVASETNWSGYVLDHFYAVTGKIQVFDYDDAGSGSKIMDQMTGEMFLPLLEKAISLIRERQPDVTRIAVWGFCFGGKLAYLSGVQPAVTDIVSCYGGASTRPGFYAGDSAVAALGRARQSDSELRVLGVFGADDPMIPADDRTKIDEALSSAKIQHDIKAYDAGHAFFNEDRTDRYDATAAQLAWVDIKQFLIKAND